MDNRQDPWSTVAAEREVLAVARSVPSVNRILDVIGLFGGDDRIEVTFTVSRGSVSEPGVGGLLRDAGVARVVAWEDAACARNRFALALAASPKGELHQLHAPLMLMPHGAGFNRLVDLVPGDLSVASGLAPSQLTAGGRVIPARLALSHSEQLDRLGKSCPPAAGRGVVVGDPTFDRMLAHQGRRDRYRQLLEIGSGHRLVVVSSTWNRNSLIGAQRDLIRRLLAELALDDYRVALIAHPNVWYRHGRAQLELWFADEIEAGLRIIPPYEGWRAAAIAADTVIGDHGSVTYYAAALGRPVLLAAFDSAELDPDSPLLRFARGARWIDPAVNLCSQVDAAVNGGGASVVDLMIDRPGGTAGRLRRLMYELLELPAPPGAAHYLPLPDPPQFGDEITAWRVEADIADSSGDGGETGAAPPYVSLRRYPAGAADPAGSDRLLVVDTEDVVVPRWQAAQAWSVRSPMPEERAADRLADALTRYPRAGVAVAETAAGWALLLDRRGGYRRVHSDPSPAGTPGDAPVIAAAAAAWACSGRSLHLWSRGVQVELGGGKTRLNSTPPPPDLPVFPRG